MERIKKALSDIGRYRAYFWWAILTICAGGSFSYLFNLATNSTIPTFSAFSALWFAAVAFALTFPYKDWKKMGKGKARGKRIRYSYLFSVCLGLAFVMGYQLRVNGMTSVGVKGKAFILLVSCGIGVGLTPLMNFWFAWMDRLRGRRGEPECAAKRVNAEPECAEKRAAGEPEHAGKKAAGEPPIRPRRIFLFSWLAIAICWIPVFLAYYPAIMSYDFHRQHQEAWRGYIWFNTHHPLIHTAMIRWFLLLGDRIGSYQIGMALFSLLQMGILSAVLAYACQMMARLLHKRWPSAVAALVFAVLPIHPVLAMSMTKDILFSAFFLLLLLLLLENRMYQGGRKGQWLLYLAILAAGILMILFRNNGVHAFLFFAVFYLIFAGKKRLQLTALCLLIVVGGQGIKSGMQQAMHAGSGSKSEMYSVVIQQFGRVGQYQGDNLSAEDSAIVNRYVPREYWEDYNAPIADTLKGNVAVTSFPVWGEDIPRMLSDWLKIGLKYPNDYIDAFLALTCGYWFFDDVSHAQVLTYGPDSNMGLLYTFNASGSDGVFEGVATKSFLPGLLRVYQYIVNGNYYYYCPVLSALFKPSTYCWLLALVMVSLCYLKEWRKLLLCALPLGYTLTTFLGPVVNMRYIYPVVVAVPLLLAWLFCKVEVSLWKKD